MKIISRRIRLGGKRITHRGSEKFIQNSDRERHHLGDLVVDGNIISKWIYKHDVKEGFG
jgi:hypothetical protein